MLLTTPAIRRFKELHPDIDVMFHTRKYTRGARYTSPYGRGAPGEMLEGNADIAHIMDWGEPPKVEWEPVAAVAMQYADFGPRRASNPYAGVSLDYPIQAHYYECLGLEWEAGQRFDSVYNITDEEREWAAQKLPESGGPYLVLTPDSSGWPGKAWRKEAWMELAIWADSQGLRPVVMAGERMPQFARRGTLNMTGDLSWRQNGAILARADLMVATEGGLSNLRAAVNPKQIVLTCATQIGVTVWMPPETVELRYWGAEARAEARAGASPIEEASCQPCLWRRDHVKYRRADVPPANIAKCPAGRSLRDLPVLDVTATITAQGGLTP